MLEHAVHAQTHPVIGLIRLEVDIRCAALDGIHQHLVDELDHRSIISRIGIDPGSALVVPGIADVEVFQTFRVIHVGNGSGGGVVCVLDGAHQLLLIDQDGFDDVVRLELDLIKRTQVGRIGNTNEQAVATLEQGQRLVLVDQFFLDQLERDLRQIQRSDVKQRYAEFECRSQGDLVAGHQAVLYQPGADGDFLLAGVFQGLARVRFAEQALGNQAPADTGKAGQWTRIQLCCHKNVAQVPETIVESTANGLPKEHLPGSIVAQSTQKFAPIRFRVPAMGVSCSVLSCLPRMRLRHSPNCCPG